MESKRRRWRKIFVSLFILSAILFLAATIVVRRMYYHNLEPVNASQRSQQVTIPKDASLNQITAALKRQGLIRSDWAFKIYVRNKNAQDKLQAGTYTLRSTQNVQDIVALLSQGQVATDLVTILPGQRIDQIRSNFVRSGFSAADVDAALDPAQYRDQPALVDKPPAASLEGYLYPESFQKTTETNPHTIVKAALDEMQKHLTPDLRGALVRQGLTVHQGIILGSIIEQEVSKVDDRPKVAQVFLKRLRQGVKLESDATAPYGAVIAGRPASITFNSPYNTYNNVGLPPTPISNVSESSIKAVAYPTGTDWLFFVSGDDGVTYFSNTIEEHQALTAQHCKRLCSGTR